VRTMWSLSAQGEAVGALRDVAKGMTGVPRRESGAGEGEAVLGGVAMDARSWSNDGRRSLWASVGWFWVISSRIWRVYMKAVKT